MSAFQHPEGGLIIVIVTTIVLGVAYKVKYRAPRVPGEPHDWNQKVKKDQYKKARDKNKGAHG